MNLPGKLAVGAARGPAGALALRAMQVLARVDRLAVLMYHRIIAEPAALEHLTPGLASATVADFDQQLRYASQRFRVISLEELLALRENPNVRGKRPLMMVTFDDAYRDFPDRAWPVIQRYRVPATMFVTSGMPDAGAAYWWDQLAHSIRISRAQAMTWGLRRLPLLTGRQRAIAYNVVHDALQQMPQAAAEQWVARLTETLGTGAAPTEILGWRELRHLTQAGLAIGAHSHSHHRLDLLASGELKSDIANCLAIITREIGTQPRAFAYPAGFYSRSVMRAVEEAGFEVAFTTRRGVSDPRQLDLYRVPRINVGLASNARVIGLQALGLRRHRTKVLPTEHLT